jgi:hypothetical protein
MGKVYVADVIVITPDKQSRLIPSVVMGEDRLSDQYTRGRVIETFCDRKTAKFKKYKEECRMSVIEETFREVGGL